MLRVNEGRLDEAWDDLLACHRLARLAAQGPTLVELLVGTNADAMACAGDQGMLQHVRLTAAQALKMRDDLAKLSPISELVEKLDVTERFSYLDCAGMAARQGVDALTDLTGDSESSGATRWLTGVALGRVDWDQVLRMGNSWYDRLADAYRKPTWTERQKAHREIDGELGAMIRDLDAAEDWKWLTPSALFSPRKSVTQRIGLRLASVLIPGPAVADAEDRGAMQFELTRLAFALAAYRADHGSYPAKLADLAPKYVAEVPKDIFSAADLHYKQERGGYLLYSVGPNGKDDGGKGRDDRREPEDFNQDWDDIAVRVPGPAAEK
jgi:hypothetical protein